MTSKKKEEQQTADRYLGDMLEMFKQGYLMGYAKASGDKPNKKLWRAIVDDVSKAFERSVLKNGHSKRNRRTKQSK